MNKVNKLNKIFIMNKLLIVGLMLTIVVSSISGCQLAEKDGNYKNSEITDQLIGVMITTEPLAEEKIYGETYVEDGKTKVKFDIDDAMAAYKVQGVDYVELDFDEHFYYKQIGFNTSENDFGIEKSEEIMLKMYFDEKSEEIIFYLNSIYVDVNNNIYLSAAKFGEYISHNIEINDVVKSVYEKKLSNLIEKVTTTFEVNIVDGVIHDKVNIISMADDSTEISKIEYEIDGLEEGIKIPDEASYIIVEKLHKGEVVEREIINKAEEGKRILITEKGKNGFLIPRHIEVDWIEN